MTWDEMMEEIKKSSPEALETIEKAQVYAKLLNEFVDKNAVMEAYCKDCPVEDCKDYCADVQWIFELPAVDVAPVVHGRWIYKGARGRFPVCECSVCGNAENADWAILGNNVNYCPNCGARMDLEAI